MMNILRQANTARAGGIWDEKKKKNLAHWQPTREVEVEALERMRGRSATTTKIFVKQQRHFGIAQQQIVWKINIKAENNEAEVAYSDKWWDRLDSFIQLAQELKTYWFEPPPTSKIVYPSHNAENPHKIETAPEEQGEQRIREPQDLTQQLGFLFEGLISRWEICVRLWQLNDHLLR
jgi:hypothetical protein